MFSLVDIFQSQSQCLQDYSNLTHKFDDRYYWADMESSLVQIHTNPQLLRWFWPANLITFMRPICSWGFKKVKVVALQVEMFSWLEAMLVASKVLRCILHWICIWISNILVYFVGLIDEESVHVHSLVRNWVETLHLKARPMPGN